MHDFLFKKLGQKSTLVTSDFLCSLCGLFQLKLQGRERIKIQTIDGDNQGGKLGIFRRWDSTFCFHFSFPDETRRKCFALSQKDCLGSFFNFKRCMECPNCRDLEIGKWVCSRSYAPNGDGDALEGVDVDLRNLNITVTPLASVWDSLEEVPQLQPSSDSSGTLPVDTALAEGVQAELGLPTPAAITPPKAPLLFSQETDDLHIEANVLEHYRELYPGLYRTVMTIQRVSASVGGGSNGQERTDESIWAEPSLPYEAGDTDELTDEQIWAMPSFPPAAGSREPPK